MGDTSSSTGDGFGVQQQIQALANLQQPPSALPDICRAVFGAATPAKLSALYDLGTGSNVTGGDGGQPTRAAITAATAAWTLLLDSRKPPSQLVLHQFVQDVFLPLTAALGPDAPEGAQQLQQLSELLARHQAWGLAFAVLQCAHGSLQSVLSTQQPAQQVSSPQERQVQVELLPPTACAVVKQLAAAASCAARDAAADSMQGSAAAAGQLHAVLQLAAGPLFDTTLQLLCCADRRVRQAGFQQVLPELLQAAAALGCPARHRACLDQLLQQCLDMVSATGSVVPRRMGLAVLLQYWADWQLQPPSASDSASAVSQQQPAEDASCSSSSQAAANSRFWQLLRECLVDSEPLNRKRALRLLQLLLPKAQLQSEPEWGVFMALYELLDEFTPHLVKATWPMISHLHRPAAAYVSEDPAADIPTAGKINPLSRGLQALQLPSQQQQEQLAPMAFCWSSILWTQALQHSNLQVQRMALKTLLKRDWSQQMLQQVPASFITQVLLPALLSPMHHNTQPMSNLARSGAVVDPHKQPQSSSSSSDDVFDITQQAAQLLRSYVLCAGPAAAREVFSGGLQVANLLKQDASRAGLQSVLQVLATAAEQLQTAGPGLLDGLTAADAEAFAEASLRKLQHILARTMPWHGTSYKVACCCLIARVAAAVAPPGSCSLATCARLLQEVPLWMLCPGRGVDAAVRAWLAGSDSSWVAEAAAGMWQQYLAGDGSSSGSSTAAGAQGGQQQQQPWCATAPDYGVWRAASDAWLRVVLCTGDDLQQLLAAAVAELAGYTEQIMSRPYLPVGLPDRVLIMTTQLLEVAEAACRPACQHKPEGSPTVLLSPPLAQAVLQFSAGAGGLALVRLLQLHCSCYHDSSPAELAGSRPDASAAARHATPGKLRAGLCPEAWQATARAESTAQAAAAAAVLLAQYLAAGGQQGSVSGVSVQQVLTSLTQLLQQMVAVSQALAAKPLPAAAVEKTAGDSRAAWGPAAAAAECSRASAVLVLRYLSQGLSRALSRLAPQHLPHDTLRLQPAVLISAVLRETAAAAAAKAHWEPALAAAGATGDISAAWLSGLDWPCLDAALALTGLLGSHSTAAAAGVGAHAARAGCGGGERVPPGAVHQDVLVLLLVEALSALAWSPLDALVHLLRCVRRVWALAVQDSSLQAAVLAALEAAGLAQQVAAAADASSPASSVPPLVALAASLAHSLLQVLHGNKKRPFLLCGCLVNTLLLPELMLFDPVQQPQLVALHAGPDAPLRRFVGGVLQQGASGSPTAHLVVALRLAACVPAAPHLLGWYHEELQALLLFGTSIEGGLDSKLSLSSPEAATEWALLAEPLETHLAAAGVMAGMGPRIAVVTALCQLAAAAGLVPSSPAGSMLTPSSQGPGGGGDLKKAAMAAGVELWREWMQFALHDPVLSSETHRNGCAAHRGRVRVWQGLAALAAFLGAPSEQEAATQGVKDLLAVLECFNPPSVKQYQEASLTYLLLKHQHLIPQLLLPHLMDLEKGGPATASHILAAVQACLHSSQQEQLLPQLVNLLLPWSNHHTHNIRTFAQLGLCAVLDARPLDTWPAWQQGLGQGGVELLRALQCFFNGNTDFQRFRRSIGAGMLHWKPDAVVTPAGIFCSSLSLAGYDSEDGQARVTFEGCPQSLMDTVVHFLHVERTKLREAAVDKAATAAEAAAAGGSRTNGQAPAAAGGGSRDAGEQAAPGPAASGLQLDYQRKVTPSERAVLLADVLDDAFEAAAAAAAGSGGPSAPAGTCRHELVVVASLVDKVPNLAGLARTAEVLGAGTLVMSDLRVVKESQFTGISVSAERWVPLEEVKEAALLAWLRGKKAAGYSLVGLEQTAESTQLPAFRFPPKSVLVLGREKEGIPPEIISLLDATVEIPQLGVIRSLNVHVSGAIAMYEYTKQRLSQVAAG